MQNIHTAPAAQTSNIQTPSIIKNKAGYTALASYLINLYELAAPLDGNAVADDMFFGLSEILLLAETQRELNDTAIFLLKRPD